MSDPLYTRSHLARVGDRTLVMIEARDRSSWEVFLMSANEDFETGDGIGIGFSDNSREDALAEAILVVAELSVALARRP